MQSIPNACKEEDDEGERQEIVEKPTFGEDPSAQGQSANLVSGKRQ